MTKPAVSLAVEFLSNGMVAQRWPDGSKLPPLNTLAAMGGVSRSTMWKAIKLLEKQGKLSVIARKAVFAGSVPVHPTLTAGQPSLLWQKKRTLFERDIVTGRYSRDRLLPPAGELQLRYGVCFMTLKKILNALVDDRVIVPYKKSYMIPYAGRKVFGATIVWVSGALSAVASTPVGLRSRRLIDQLEGECARANISLEMLTIDHTGRYADLREHLATRKKKTILGYIVDLQWVELQRPGAFVQTVRQLASDGMPVAILDQVGEFTFPAEPAPSAPVRVFRCAAITAGRQVARILLPHGHEKIAYISHQHQGHWSRDRLEGLRQSYTKAGFPDGVIPLVSHQTGGFCERVFGAAGLDKQDFLRLIGGLEEESQYAEAFKNDDFESLANVFVSTHPKPAAAIHSGMVRYGGLVRKPVHPAFLGRVQRAIFDAATDCIIMAEMEPLFEKAFGVEGISAWVAATDGTAVAALNFLHKRRVEVPAGLSLVGFDNSFVALDHRVSSYDFNVPSMIQTMLDFIRESPRFNRHSPDSPVEVEGYFVFRDTLGRKKGSAPAGIAG